MNEMTSPTYTPMSSVEAEQQLLGAIMLDSRAFFLVSDIINAEHFHDPVHADVFRLCTSRINNGDDVSPVIMASLMAQHPGLAALGGGKYLVRMAGVSVGTASARGYAQTLVEMWQRRTVAEALSSADRAIRDGGPISEALNVITAVGDAMSVTSGKPASVSFMGALTEAMQGMNGAVAGDATGVTLGLHEFDHVVGPMRPGDMIVLGGAPSMGKTSLALAIANRAAAQKIGVAIVSLEMTGQSLAFRALGEASGVPYEKIIAGDLTADEIQKVIEGAGQVSDRPIEIVQPHIKDLHAINAALLRIRASLESRGTPLGLVLIDYLQLVRAPGKDRFQQVSAASSGIKSLAMQLGVPVVALSQLSRGLMERDDKRPLLSDLRESGQIEQDADLVLFVHREAYYLERSKPRVPKGKDAAAGALADHEAALAAVRDKVEVICAKKRMGRIGSTTLGFDPATNRVWSLKDRREELF